MERTSKMKVLFVCHGNICRSPMAEYYFKKIVSGAGLSDMIEVQSAATSSEELGNPVYPLAKRTLAVHGIGCRDKVAQLLTRRMYDESDYVVGMDQANLKNIRDMVGAHEADEGVKLFKLLDFVKDADGEPLQRDIADPWYTRNFDKAWDDISLGCRALLEHIKSSTLCTP